MHHRPVSQADVLNRGFGGYTTRWALPMVRDVFPSRTPQEAPILATIFFGANDAALKDKMGYGACYLCVIVPVRGSSVSYDASSCFIWQHTHLCMHSSTGLPIRDATPSPRPCHGLNPGSYMQLSRTSVGWHHQAQNIHTAADG